MKKKFIIDNVLLYSVLGIILLGFVVLTFLLRPKIEIQEPVYIEVCDGTDEKSKMINEIFNQLSAGSQRNTIEPCEKTLIREIVITEEILSYPILENQMKDRLNDEIYEVEFKSVNEGSAGNLVVYVDKDTLKIIGIRGGRD